MEAIKVGETFFVNVVLEDEESTADKKVSGGTQSKVEPLTPEEEYKRWLDRQTDKRKRQGRPHCVSAEEEYILWKERDGKLAQGDGKDVEKEEDAWEKRMIEGEEQRTVLREYPRESLRTEKRKIMNMSMQDMKRKLAESGWRPKPEDDSFRKMGANLKRRVE
jgi:hypothetical protein